MPCDGGQTPEPAGGSRHAVPLRAVRSADRAAAGGKAAHLGELLGSSFPVPDGFVVPAATCGAFFEATGIGSLVARLEGAASSERADLCDTIQQLLVAREIDEVPARAICSAHARLVEARGPGLLCAVRSSGTAEDLAGASFAGQHGTYYYVGADRLLEMIRRCWASLFSAEAVTYRARHGVGHRDVLMAVVVQEMVASEVSGVAFTANPVTGDRDEVVIEASWGMGAALVDGRVTPDRFVVRRAGLEVRERRIADKRFLVPTRPDPDSDSRLRGVPHALRRRASLSPEQVRVVAEWALRCEEHFGTPQDVEWAFAGGGFHLLQARPVTTLATAPPPAGRWVIFKAMAENFTDPVTPLTADVFRRIAPPGLSFIGGRAYLDLAVLRRLLPFEATDRELADVMLLRTAPRRLRLSPWRGPGALAMLVLGYLSQAVFLRRTRRLPDAALEAYRGVCRKVLAEPGLDAPDALVRLWLPGTLKPIGEMAVLVNLCAARFVPWLGALRWMLRRWAPRLDERALAVLSHGSRGVLSAQLGRDVAELARLARASPRVSALLDEVEPSRCLERLRAEPEARDFVAGLDRFLERHGHRAVKEFELLTPRFAEQPAPVLAMVRNQLSLDDPGGAHESRLAAARDEVRRSLDRALSTLPLERLLGVRRRLVAHAAERARYYLKLRENSRFYHIMAFAVVRAKVLEAEAELRRLGRLRCADDVFFLRWSEVVALRDGRLRWSDVEDRIRERRIEHARQAVQPPPSTIGVLEPPEPPAGDAQELHGLCASPGLYEGVARVVLDPSLDVLRPGEVLVAPYTDPAWTPLFLTAGAAVVEVGSYLSHAGTVAREFGMPCVVDVADCTRRISTGMRVHVDATRGHVRLSPPESDA